MCINDGGDIYPFSLDNISDELTTIPYINKVIKEKSVALHEHVRTDSGD